MAETIDLEIARLSREIGEKQAQLQSLVMRSPRVFGMAAPRKREQDMLIVALSILAERNVPEDVQRLLIEGDESRGIAPGALLAMFRHFEPVTYK